MKKFKLIKEYPSSPEVGAVRDEQWFKNKFNPQYEAKYWQQLREVLFITEDGVEKRHMDEYYFVWFNCKTSGDRYPRTWLGHSSALKLIEDTFTINEDRRYFHSYTEAKKFVVDNTPILTVDELIKIGVDNSLLTEIRRQVNVKMI